jgi:hypothetical protein
VNIPNRLRAVVASRVTAPAFARWAARLLLCILGVPSMSDRPVPGPVAADMASHWKVLPDSRPGPPALTFGSDGAPFFSPYGLDTPLAKPPLAPVRAESRFVGLHSHGP